MQPYPTIQNYTYNPYLMSGQNQSSYMPMQMTSQVSGKYVNDFNEITANDVPMNGSSAIFFKNDGSEIQVRKWSPNGQIITTQYLPHIDKKDTEVYKLSTEEEKSKFDAKSEVFDPLFKRLERLENKIDKISRSARPKKEVADE